jgi:hypothetical protein
MEPLDERHESARHENAGEASTTISWVPDLAERLETLERANVALERARLLLERLERVNRFDSLIDKAPGD